MSSTSLVKAEHTLERAKALAKNTRVRAKSMEASAVQRASMVVGAASLAEVEQHVPAVFMKLPTKIWMSAAGYILAALTKGNVSRVAIGAADAIASVYAYKAAYQLRAKKPNPAVAGETGTGYIEEP